MHILSLILMYKDYFISVEFTYLIVLNELFVILLSLSRLSITYLKISSPILIAIE